MIADNWTVIKNCMEKYDWVDTKTIKAETGMIPEIISKTLKAKVARGLIEKQFINHNITHQWNGDVKRYKFIWRLKR
jgi:RIO-like serine/threonine protein kinase